MKPSVALRVVATHVSTAANAGAPHGAATIPEVAPSTNTPEYDPPVRRPAHCSRRCGADTGNTSSMARPNTSSRFPITNRAHGLAHTVPDNEPLSLETRTTVTQISPRPAADASARFAG